MITPGESAQETLRDQIKELIALLAQLRFDQVALDRAFAANKPLIKDEFRPRQKRSGYASTFERLFNFKGNARKYLGTERNSARLTIEFRHVRCIWDALTALGFRLGAPMIDADPTSWSAALTHAMKVVANGLDAQGSVPADQPELIAHPRWRLVERPDIATAILDRLESFGAVALTGMPGIGKSVLAKQVAVSARDRNIPVCEPDAGYWQPTTADISEGAHPSAVRHVGLWAAVLRQVARLPAPNLTLTRRGRFNRAVAAFLQHWTKDSAHLTPAEVLLVEKIERHPAPAGLARSIVVHASDLRSMKLTVELCAILRTASPEAIILLDNVSGIEAAQAACVALFGRDPDGQPSPLRLLLTSQRADDDLAFLVGAEAAGASTKLVDFEDRRFAQKVVAAWSVSGDEDRTQREAEAGIEIFRVTRMARDAALSADIDRVIARVGGHALALAALASVWRYGGYRRNFWRQASAAIQAAPADILQLEVTRDPDRMIEPRHADVLQALQLAWALLDDGQSDWQATRERFLDLGVSRPNEPIDENIFNEFWKRVPRGPRQQRLAPVVASRASPLRRLQSASFVQPLGGNAGQFILHDLHRILIEHEVGGRAGVAARHREFLRTFGWLDAGGSLRSDEATHYAIDDGRTEVRPDLGPDADEAETAEVGRYLLDSLPHHVQGAAPEEPEARLVALATSFQFLQARLDAADGDLTRPSEQGNVAFLATVLQRQTASPLPWVRHAVRLAAEGIAHHRRQLAGQLLARIPAHHHPALDGLRAGASRSALRPSFAPPYPFLADIAVNLRGRIAAAGGFNGVEWLGASAQAPLILAWSKVDIVLWDIEIGEIRLSFPHGGSIARATWIADAPGGPAILGWSFMGKRIALWDANTGEPRLQIEADHDLDEVRWISDAPGGPAILSWSRFKPSPICLWDAQNGAVRLRLPRSETADAISSGEFGADWIAATPDGPAILGWATTDRMIHIWDAVTGDEHLSVQAPNVPRGVIWIPDAIGAPGILSWSSRGAIRVWNALTGIVQREWLPLPNAPAEHADDDTSWMSGARWIPAGPHGPAVLWWSLFDRRAHLWDVKSGDTLAQLPHGSGVGDAQWIPAAPEGPVILTRAHDAIHLWDGRTGRDYGSLHDACAVMEAHWVPPASDGAPGILSRWSDRTVRLHEFDLRRERTRITPQEGVAAVEWIDTTPDGPAILTSSPYTPGAVCVWSPASEAQASNGSPRHAGLVWGVAWLPTTSPPSEIMSWSSDHTVRVRDALRGEERLKVTHDGDVSHAAWIPATPAGPSAILSCSDDRTVRLWAASEGEELARTVVQDRGSADGLDWTIDAGGQLAAVIWHFDGRVCVWRPWTGRRAVEIRHEKIRGVRLEDDVLGAAAIFSWATDGGSLRCWDLATGDERGRFEAPAVLEGVDWIPQAPVGPAILGWAGDHVLLWDAATGDRLFQVRHDRKVVRAKWVADVWGAPAILSSSYDNTIRLWSLSGDERLRLAGDQSAPFASWIDKTPAGPAILSWSIIDARIILWDPETKQRRVQVHHDDDVSEAVWLPDVAQPAILSWARDRTIRLWDAADNELIARFDLDSAAVSIKVREASRRGLELAVGCMDGAVGSLKLLEY